MKLSALLERVGANRAEEATDVTIAGISFDSRTTTRGDLFVAVTGSRADGHDFIREAVANGAVAVIGEKDPATVQSRVPYFALDNSRRALAVLAQEFYGNPSRDLLVVGVTGTNGKTSTVFLSGAVLDRAGYPACVLTTLGYRVGDRVYPASQTTPDPILIARTMKEAVEAKHLASVVEVSSHALDQYRVDGIEFDVAIFTNLTQDHLDYHETMDRYFLAKLRLFEMLDVSGTKSRERVAILNGHDAASEKIARSIRTEKLFYGMTDNCAVRAADVVIERARTVFTLVTCSGERRVALSLTGEHNVLNALAAASLGVHLGVPLDQIVEGLESVEAVPGRFERVDCGQPFAVVVDYAHTDDGLRNLIRAARGMTPGRLIVLFGCGGDRDRGKRPRMGYVAATMGDYVVITSDNPRSEDPAQILRQIERGVMDAGKQRSADYELVVDRRDAIERAISMATEGDCVLIAGKGHETEQIFADRRVPFDDRAVASEILQAHGWKKRSDGGK